MTIRSGEGVSVTPSPFKDEVAEMEAYLKGIKGISGFMNAVAAICLTFIMLLTTLDVILRTLKTPIVGTYELVGFMGGLIIGLAIPMTSWARGAYIRRLRDSKASPGKPKSCQYIYTAGGDRVFHHSKRELVQARILPLQHPGGFTYPPASLLSGHIRDRARLRG